jgi:hypothetical protein
MRAEASRAPAVVTSITIAASQWIAPGANEPAPSRIARSTISTCSHAGSHSTGPIGAVASGNHAASTAPITAFG